MNSISNRNINFMVFDSLDVIENYLSSEIVRYIQSQPKLNLSIESRTDFYNLFNKLRDGYLNNKVSFRNVNFFMTDDYIFDTNNWNSFAEQSSEGILQSIFFSQVDFDNSNLHPILNELRFKEFNNNIFINYDSEIDAANGLDVIVLKMQPNGSLIFNDVINSNQLSSKGVYLNKNIEDNIISEFGGVHESLPVSCATLGIDQILKAKKVYIVGFGSNVANTLQKLFYTKDYDKTVPTCLLKNHPNVTVLVDKDASIGIFTPSRTEYISKLVQTVVEPVQNTPIQQFAQQPVVQEQVYQQPVVQEQYAQQPVEQQQYADPAYQQQPVDQQYVEPTYQDQPVDQQQYADQAYEQQPLEQAGTSVEIDLQQDGGYNENGQIQLTPEESSLEDEYDFDSLNDFQDID